jgi:hypothetical protein
VIALRFSFLTSDQLIPDETLADIKKSLAEEEHRNVVNGRPPPIEMTPSGFLIEGLQIEQAQYVSASH